jgi:arginase family enzyme
MISFDILESHFIKPEFTKAGCNFCDIPKPISFDRSNVNIIGVPIDITTTFGKTTSLGPAAIRTTSAKQIETLVYEKNVEKYDKSKIYDLGDYIFPNETCEINSIEEIELFWKQFDKEIKKVITFLLHEKKKPIFLGGEHTITYSIFKEFSGFDPLLLHFDAHRDLKPMYNGMSICHTTPFYHLINEGYLKSQNLVQIGIRQADRDENLFAFENQITTFDAWECHYSFDRIKEWVKHNSKKRNIYISFDIDVYDISYVPCTGTAEPFGLDPFQIYEIISNIDKSAHLIGLDFVETGLKNNDYREAALATQTLLRILSHDFIE